MIKASRLVAAALVVFIGLPLVASAQGVTGKIAYLQESRPDCPAAFDADLWVQEQGQAPRVLLGHTDVVSANCDFRGYTDLDWSPDGQMIVAERGNRAGRSGPDIELVIVDLRGGERVLSRSSGFVPTYRPRWSPRGDTVAVVTGECAGIQLIPIAGGTGRCLTATLDDTFGGVAWSPDGRELAYISPGRSSIRARATDASSDRVIATAPAQRGFTLLDWSPDGRQLAASLEHVPAAAAGDLALVDATTGAVRTLRSSEGGYNAVSWTADGRQLLFGRLAVDPTTGRSESLGLPDLAYQVTAFGPAFLAPGVQSPVAQVPVSTTAAAPGATAAAGTGAAPGATRPGSPRHSRFSYAVDVVEPDEVSRKPGALVVSLLIALALLLVVFPAHLFNATFEKNYDRITAPFKRRSRRESPPRNAWLAFGVMIVATAFLGGLLDPTFGTDRASLVAVSGTALAVLLTSMTCGAPGRAWISRKYHATTRLTAYPASLFVAGATVAVSRGLEFRPGYLYGIVGGFAVLAKPSKEDAGKSSSLGAVVTMVIALLAWIVRIPVAHRVARDSGVALAVIDTALAAVFAAGFSSLVFAMVPLRYLPGETIYKWRRSVWAVLFGIGAYALVHGVMTPVAGAGKAALTAAALFVAFGLGSVLFWAWFQVRPDPVPIAVAVEPDAPAPVELPDGWAAMTVAQLRTLLPELYDAQLAALREAEVRGKARRTLLDAIDRRLRD